MGLGLGLHLDLHQPPLLIVFGEEGPGKDPATSRPVQGQGWEGEGRDRGSMPLADPSLRPTPDGSSSLAESALTTSITTGLSRSSTRAGRVRRLQEAFLCPA